MKFSLQVFMLYTFLLTGCIFDTDKKTDAETDTKETTTPAKENHIAIDTLPAKDSTNPPVSQKDTDKDGINDSVDKCPSEKGPASNKGCPVVVPLVTPLPPIDTIVVR